MAIGLTLPWPTGASVNHLYANRRGGGKRLSDAARDWREQAIVLVKMARIILPVGDLALHVRATPPDRRKHDCDNLLKLSIDSIAAALDFDDSRIAYVGIERSEPDRVMSRLDVQLQSYDSWRALHHRPVWPA